MLSSNPIFLIDFYKVGHIDQYPKDTQYVFSNWTPRKSYIAGTETVVHFGVQYFIKEILERAFDEGFFNRKRDEVVSEYRELIRQTLGTQFPRTDHIEALHHLQYLPIKIYSLPEGTNVPLGVPALIITNTDPRFFWLPNYLETILSSILWKPSTSATIAQRFRRLFVKHATEARERDLSFIDWQGHDFSFRGMSGREDAKLSGMGHLLSFSGTDTIPAIIAANEFYGAPLSVGGSVNATEHSVMCAGGETSEADTFRRLTQEVYPKGIVSIVSDTWDLWNVLRTIIPSQKDEILSRDGKIVIRPDSGDPVKIVVGDPLAVPGSPAYIGALRLLAEALGTTDTPGGKMINKGGLIYGDGITYERADNILSDMREAGFSPYNMVFGIGSFTYEYQTRDTFGFAMKATAVVRDGELIDIFKNPVTDDGLKKSRKGIPLVVKTQDSFTVVEGVSPLALDSSRNAMKLVYENGRQLVFENFSDIRERVRA